ncbi:uncharacterized protein LOC128014940 isoform X2 [Carassius gibelio]|uniref:uncharacterized protein LOC128014940 isoform X2 n=1 Tax=Carassius gibelio TaxID=101364 RepID=UPI002279253C|nr:uncharacterized protein LOC128014940 isoform X2 [Carassius gibelio]
MWMCVSVSQPAAGVHPVRPGFGVTLQHALTGCYWQTTGPDGRRLPDRSDRRLREVYFHHAGGAERCGSVHQEERKSLHL